MIKIKQTYLIFLIVIGLVSLSLYTTYAMFTASTTLNNVVNFDTSLSLNPNLLEYELITLTGNETQVIEVNVTNSYDSTLCYGIWYEVVSGDSSSLDIGTFTEKNTTLPSGQITSGSTITAVVGMNNNSDFNIVLKLGTIGKEISNSSCSLGITSPKSLIGTDWDDVILVTDEYLSEHIVTSSEDYFWSSSTSGSTTLTLQPGTYKLEVWGAEGGKAYDYKLSSGGGAGGKGGYSYGTLTLSEITTIYAYVGGQGTAGDSTTSVKSGGFNGGANSGYYYGGAGGGATDLRIGTDSLYARVIVAGGGGGGANYNSTYIGGAGGGISGVDGAGYNDAYTAKGGSSTSGGTAGGYSGYTGSAGSFGKGGAASTASSSYNRSGGGGGGWYGGGGGGYYSLIGYYYQGVSGGGGGSGYVYTSFTASNCPSGCLLNSNYYLTNAATKTGASSFVDFDGTEVTGHSGDGAVKITGTTNAIYSIPTLTGLNDLNVVLGKIANFTKNVEIVCEEGATSDCSILTYPTLDTSTLEVGTYTVYYIIKGSDNKKYKYLRTINVIDSNSAITNFNYTGAVQVYTVNYPGTYKLEVWGAQGAGGWSGTSGSNGGYSYGTIYLEPSDVVYVQVGEVGKIIEFNKKTGAYNGGGSYDSSYCNFTYNDDLTVDSILGGGGATDIRINADTLYNRVIVAGGGGGGVATTRKEIVDGYTTYTPYTYNGGVGGGEISGGSTDKTASQVTGYSFGIGEGACGAQDTSYTYAYWSGSAGGGWYGGFAGGGLGTSSVVSSGGGGSGWVYTESTYNTWCTGDATNCNSWSLTNDYYLTDAATIAGDQSFTDYTGTTVTGHSGNGCARITYLG